MNEAPNLYVESVYAPDDRRRAYRVVYRNVEIKTFTRREHADEFVTSIQEAVR